MKFFKQQFEAAQKLFGAIDTECDCRIWNKDGKNEETYRKLKGAVRAWSYAITFGYMNEEGEVLVNENDILLAREYEVNGSKTNWGGELHTKYLNNTEYRVSINAGSKILEVEGISNLTAAQAIYDSYKGQFAPKDGNRKPNYSELVLSGRYHE